MHNEQISQAYLNEYKGSLFEFLMAQGLARHFNTLSEFYKNTPERYFELFKEYEKSLRNFEIGLVEKLILLSQKTLSSFLKEYKFKSNGYRVKILGKFSDQENEADILLTSEKEEIPISLKLCKTGHFINTKSAGVKSFLKKYFDLKNEQEELNSLAHIEFESFSREIHDLKGLDFDIQYKSWRENNLSELPSSLEGESKLKIKKLYHVIAKHLHRILIKLEEEKPEVFKKAISKLCGLADNDIIMLTCFHKGTNDHEFSNIHIGHYQEKSKWKVLEINSGLSSFEIEGTRKVLQIRIKPMNKFTAPSYKVNCSVKYK